MTNPSTQMEMFTAGIPQHLHEYITYQDPDLYTPIDQALWRYVMRVSKAFFSKHAHPMYLQGLEATGISTERIPLVEEMDQALRAFGWRAVPINGFIPPSIFLEFQSLRILAIACDIRNLGNLGYTPSPDIIHEAAGHAPIVADAGYRAYLEAYGDAARNAIISKFDIELYEAIFELSELKENPHSTQIEIETSQKKFEEIASREAQASEAAMLARIGWWTTEYGLFGNVEKPVVYGAGLLSSVYEIFHCLDSKVKKIPFSLEKVLTTSYDITRPQPQLFVAENFELLTAALNEFAESMAFRRGGIYGLEIAKQADHTVTLVLDTGVQITGTVGAFEQNETKEETSVTLKGAKQISYLNRASEEVDIRNLGTTLFIPLFEKSISSASLSDIQRKLHGSGLHTKGGLRIQGRFKKEALLGGIGRILILEQVKVTDMEGKVVFEENQKIFPLSLASKIISVAGGAADRQEFQLRNSPRSQKVKSHKSNLTRENASLNELYRQVRNFREAKRTDLETLLPLTIELYKNYPNDWLLKLELYEIFQEQSPSSVNAAQLRNQLQAMSIQHPEFKEMIQRGMSLV